MAIQERQGKSRTRYAVVMRVNGKSEYFGTFDSRAEAEEAEVEAKYVRKQIRSGRMSASAVATRRTVGDLADEYIKSLESTRAKAHSSRADYTRIMAYWRARIGSIKLSEIRQLDIHQLLEELSAKYQPATVDGYLTPLSGCFSWAIAKHWMTEHPCKGLDFINDRGNRASRDYLWLRTRGEIEQFIAAFEPGDWRDIAIVAIATGLRIGEVQALRWSDVSLERRLITVQRSVKGPTKSRKIRHVPVLNSALPTLRARRLAGGGATLVFPGEKGGYFSRSSLRKRVSAALAVARFDSGIRIHDLRHTFASHWMANGGDIFKLSKVLGHSSVKVTEKFYAHLAPDAFNEDLGRVEFSLPEANGKVIALTSAD